MVPIYMQIAVTKQVLASIFKKYLEILIRTNGFTELLPPLFGSKLPVCVPILAPAPPLTFLHSIDMSDPP